MQLAANLARPTAVLWKGLAAAKIEIDRKALADLVVTDEATFKAILDKAVAALDQKRSLSPRPDVLESTSS